VVLLHILQFKLTTKYLFLSRQLAELHAAIKYGTIQLGRNQFIHGLEEGGSQANSSIEPWAGLHQ